MSPRDAERMLLDPAAIRFACDPYLNAQFWKADARTRDFRGLRLVDYVGAHDAVDEAAKALKETVTALLEGREVELDPLRVSEIPRPGQSPRVVFIATYYRRCLSNLVSHVLAETSKDVLPSNVRAYVPGRHDPVPEAVLDLAEAVRRGRLRYWWKIDFKAFFASVPHGLIEESMRHYGFTPRIVRLALACVRTPIHKRVAGGRWAAVPNLVGAPMGLAESSVLANLACFSFDDLFEVARSRITQVRYSDDILGGARLKEEAVGAVRNLRKWTQQHGLKIKGMSPRTRTATLVHDIHRERMPALGVEIDREGCIHIPRSKLEAKLKEIDEGMAALRRHNEGPLENNPVVETSVYAGSRGTDFRDLDDIRSGAEEFESYWKRFNLEEASAFRAEVNKRHPEVLSQRTSGTVWIASLGSPGGAGGGGHVPPAPSSETSAPRQGPPLTRSPGQGEDSIIASSEEGDGTTQREASMVEVEGTNDRFHDLDEDPVLGFGDQTEEEAGPFTDTLPRRGVDDEAVAVEDSSGSDIDTDRGMDEGPTPSPDGEIVSSQVAATFPRPDQRTRSGTGTAYEPSSPEPPRGSALDNSVFIVARRVPFRRGGPGVVVATLYGDPNAPGEPAVVVDFVPNARAEVALLGAIENLVATAQRRGDRRLDIHLESTALPKHLVVTRRSFHNPAYFRRVLALHRALPDGGLRVRILGGEEVPACLQDIEGRWRRQGVGRRAG